MKGIKFLDKLVKIIALILVVAFFAGAFKFLILDNELLFPEEKQSSGGGVTNTGTNSSGGGTTTPDNESGSGNVDTTPEGDSSGSTDEGGTITPGENPGEGGSDEGGTTTPGENPGGTDESGTTTPDVEPEDYTKHFTFTAVDGGYEVSSYTGTVTDIIIPSTYNGQPVVGIGDEAFYDNHVVQKVTIPEGVKRIGNKAFMGCWYLTYVSLPDSLNIIGLASFSYCSSLEFMFLPLNVSTFGEGIFSESLVSTVGVEWKSTDPRKRVDFGKTVSFDFIGKGVEPEGFNIHYMHTTGGYKILGYTGYFNDDLIIPKIHLGEPVVEIGEGAFFELPVRDVFIPSSVVTFGENSLKSEFIEHVYVEWDKPALFDKDRFEKGFVGLNSTVYIDYNWTASWT